MLDKMIAFGSGFDWISPLFALVRNYKNRPSTTFTIPAACGWHAYSIQDLLKNSGIQLWGFALYQDTYVFSVREAQAEYTQYLLDRAGIPYGGDVTNHSRRDALPRQEADTENRLSEPGIDGWLAWINGKVDSI